MSTIKKQIYKKIKIKISVETEKICLLSNKFNIYLKIVYLSKLLSNNKSQNLNL